MFNSTSLLNFQKIFDFTAEDLEINQAGRLSPHQISTLKQTARATARTTFFFSIAVLGFILFITLSVFPTAASRSTPFLVLALPMITPLVFGVIFGIAAVLSLKTMLFPRTPSLQETTGVVVRGNRTDNARMNEIEVNGNSFKVSIAACEYFDPAKTYSIYRAVYHPGESGTIVAIAEATSAEAQSIEATKSPLEYEKEQLARIFDFTDADLVANRAGMITPAQLVEQRQKVGNGIAGGLFFGVIFGIFPLIFISAFTGNTPVAIGITSVVVFVMVLLSMNMARSAQRKLDTITVSSTSGVATVKISKIHHSGKHHHTETVYHIKVGGIDFRVSSRAYYAFKEGVSYRVYFSKALPGQAILSAERTAESSEPWGESFTVALHRT